MRVFVNENTVKYVCLLLCNNEYILIIAIFYLYILYLGIFKINVPNVFLSAVFLSTNAINKYVPDLLTCRNIHGMLITSQIRAKKWLKSGMDYRKRQKKKRQMWTNDV